MPVRPGRAGGRQGLLLRQLIDHASKDVRCSIPVSELVVGLKCGGSDGLSGITANPLVGRIADRLVSMGGTALLAEVPEMFGAEGVLFRRCADETVQRELPALVADFKDYFVRHGQVVYENPSPGNKAAASPHWREVAGLRQKGGSSPICGVLSYGQRVQNRGLTVLQTPATIWYPPPLWRRRERTWCSSPLDGERPLPGLSPR